MEFETALWRSIVKSDIQMSGSYLSFDLGPFACFCTSASLAKGPLLSAQRPNLFSIWFGSASAAPPTCVSTRVSKHVWAHNVVRMTCITQTMHAGYAASGLVVWIRGMDMAVMWLWRPRYIHFYRLREGRNEATRPAITSRSLRCDRRSSPLRTSRLNLQALVAHFVKINSGITDV